MWLSISLLLTVLIVILIQYHCRRRHMYRFARQLPGPTALPIVGNALSFLSNSEEFLSIFTTITSAHSKPQRLWLGHVLVVYFNDPQHIEKILTSSKLANKHDLYDFVKVYLGNGLVTNSGEEHKKHRKLIQPLFNLKFILGNIGVLQKHVNILLNVLEGHVDKGTFDIREFIHNCFADIVGEIVLGIQLNAQYGKNKDYIQATKDMYTVATSRVMRPWFHPNLIYQFTQGRKDQDRILHAITKCVGGATVQARSRIRSKHEEDVEVEDSTTPIIDQIARIIEKDPSSMNDTDFLFHMFTLYAASEDTMADISTVLSVCLGMYPDYQKIAAEEIRGVFGETPKNVTYEDIMKLQYLDMCIRDVMRLVPIALFIARKTIEDFEIDSYTIPKGCAVLASILDAHRDPRHWENPEHFHPDHFLPEAVNKRHPFAFVPFSAGPRGCIGKVLAFIGIKLIMASILQRFEIEADGKFPDLVLKADPTIRLRDGYNVRLTKRTWL